MRLQQSHADSQVHKGLEKIESYAIQTNSDKNFIQICAEVMEDHCSKLAKFSFSFGMLQS